MAKKLKVVDVVLNDVKFSDLGRAIENLQGYLPSIEQMLKTMHQSNDANAKTLEYILEAADLLSYEYAEVAGYI